MLLFDDFFLRHFEHPAQQFDIKSCKLISNCTVEVEILKKIQNFKQKHLQHLSWRKQYWKLRGLIAEFSAEPKAHRRHRHKAS